LNIALGWQKIEEDVRLVLDNSLTPAASPEAYNFKRFKHDYIALLWDCNVAITDSSAIYRFTLHNQN